MEYESILFGGEVTFDPNSQLKGERDGRPEGKINQVCFHR